jgi:hypothetical protein
MMEDALAAKQWSFKRLVYAILEYEEKQGRALSTFNSMQASVSRIRTKDSPHNLQTLDDIAAVLALPSPITKARSWAAHELCHEANLLADKHPELVPRALSLLRSLKS